MATKRLYRSCKDEMIGGVAGGLAEYLDVDVILVRLIFLILLFSWGAGFVVYLIAWIIVPLDPGCKEKRTAAEEIQQKAENIMNEVNEKISKKDKIKTKNEGSIWFGAILVFLGGMILVQNITGMDVWHNFLPVMIIFVGLIILVRSVER